MFFCSRTYVSGHDRCLADLDSRPTASELLEHSFIKEYYRGVGTRQRELEEAVKALKTHIEIHKGESKGQRGTQSSSTEYVWQHTKIPSYQYRMADYKRDDRAFGKGIKDQRF